MEMIPGLNNMLSSQGSELKLKSEQSFERETLSNNSQESFINENELVTKDIDEAQDDMDEHSIGQLPGNFCEVVIKAEIEDIQDEVAIEEARDIFKIDCKICQKLFATKDGLKQHLRFVHKSEKKFSCEKCSKKFTTSYKLTWHIRDVHEKSGDFACEFCGKRFFREYDKMLHERMHTGEKPFKCGDCGSAFHRKEVLKRHQQTAHSGIKYHCHLCKYVSKEKSNLRRHTKSVHKTNILESHTGQSAEGNVTEDMIKNEDIKPNTDELEGVNNESKPDSEQLRAIELLNDLKSKPEPVLEVNVTCDFCQRTFETIKSKQKHIRCVHVKKERNFFCEYCSKAFTRADYLAKHVKVVHDQIRDFSCAYCGKQFSDKYAVTVHERIHTKPKTPPNPVQESSVCHQTMDYHEENGKFFCNLCVKSFSHKTSLSKHHQSAHLGKRYPCPRCSYEAKEKGDLLKHQRRIHDNIEDKILS